MPGFPIVAKSKGFCAINRVVEDPDADLEHMEAEDEGEGFAGVEGGCVGPEGAGREVQHWFREGHVCREE